MADDGPICANCGKPTEAWRQVQVVRNGKIVSIHKDCPDRLVAPHGPYFKFNWDWYGPSR